MPVTSSLSLPARSFSWLTSYEDKGNTFRKKEQCSDRITSTVVSTWSLDKGPGLYFCIPSMHDHYRINSQASQDAKNYDASFHRVLRLRPVQCST